MLALALSFPAPPMAELRPLLQAAAVGPMPVAKGLRARHWRVRRRAVEGSYIFEDRASADAFLDGKGGLDPALVRLGKEPGMPPWHVEQVREIAAADIFDRPVFVVSAPRAGSTLLYELLSEDDGLWTIDAESQGLFEGIPALSARGRGFASQRLTEADADPEMIATYKAALIACLRDRVGNRFLDLPPETRPARVRLLEKTTENALRVSFLAAAFPDARFIVLHRDARQNVSSIIEAWQHDGFVSIPDLPDWEPRRWCFLLPPDWRRLRGASLSDVAAFQWRAAYEHILDDLAALPRDRWTNVDYADLVAAPAAVVRRLSAFMGITPSRRLLDAAARPLRTSSTTITPPSPIKWRSNRLLQESSLLALGPLAGRLRNLNARPAVPGQRPAPLKDVRFACFLEEIGELDTEADRGALIVNPSFALQAGTTVPLHLLRRTRFRDRFLPDHPIVWIENPTTRALQPFWAQRPQLRALMGLAAGRPPPASLADSDLGRSLRGAGILATKDALRRGARDDMLRQAANDLEADRFCKLPAVMPAAPIAALGRYYRALIASGRWGLGDDQVALRHGWHNEPVARFFHWQLTEFVGRLAGEPVKPTYSYSSAYHGGAALKAHLDRRQCEFTMSLLIDQTEGLARDPWRLWFQAPKGQVAVTLGLGDAALFRGCELPHWRDAAPADQAQIMLIFHYVPLGFPSVAD